MSSLATLPAFLGYFACTLGLLAAFLAAYTALTPQAEWALIRGGNTAAALSLAGAALGFCMPLASAVAHSVGLLDMLLWAAVAGIVQVGTLLALRWGIGDLWGAIERGELAAAVAVAAGSLAVGLLNAACLTY